MLNTTIKYKLFVKNMAILLISLYDNVRESEIPVSYPHRNTLRDESQGNIR